MPMNNGGPLQAFGSPGVAAPPWLPLSVDDELHKAIPEFVSERKYTGTAGANLMVSRKSRRAPLDLRLGT